jgi:hypothetical protein
MTNDTEDFFTAAIDAAPLAAIGSGDVPKSADIHGDNDFDADRVGVDASDNIGVDHDLGVEELGGVKSVAAAIEAAEEVKDPLDGLVERTSADPGAPFEPDVLERLAALKSENLAEFRRLRAKLRGTACGVTALDSAIAARSGDDQRDPTQATILVELAGSAEMFHDPSGRGYADIEVNGHRETWAIRSDGLKRWLVQNYYKETGSAPNSEAIQSARNVLEAKANIDGPQSEVFVRVGGLDDRLYLDLGDESWRAVEIDAVGWQIIDKPPVRFRRAAGMLPLPTPATGGSIDKLRSFLNVKAETDFVLVVTWLLAALRNRGPYPIVVLSGEQGSAKSTFTQILRLLIDPNAAPLRALPREDRDLFIAAKNGHVLAFDNVSGLPNWISDTLCRLATGGGFAVRQLYTDDEETLFDAVRPIILNGIEDIVTRPDLADRALFLTLEPIAQELRRPEAELRAEFEAERPQILGVLLDAVVHGLRLLPDTYLEGLPRMADFALWAMACETALWPAGTFSAAYGVNRDDAVEGVIDADPIAAAVLALMETNTEWTGSASGLLDALARPAGELVAKSKTWPDSPRTLTNRLRRSATFLRKIGIEISYFRENSRARTRMISITTIPSKVAQENGGAPSSASSATPQTINPANGFTFDEMRTVGDPADGRHSDPIPIVRTKPLKLNGTTGADAADANYPAQSVAEKTVWRGRL